MSAFKVRVDRKSLSDALTLVAPAIPLRPSAPILAAVEIQAINGTLSIRATDWYRAIWRSVDAQVADAGTVLVSGHRLRSVVSAFSGADVDLALDGQMVVATSGRSTFRIATMDADEFPAPPELGPATGTLSADALSDALRRIQHASGGDELEAVKGISIASDGTDLAINATDRFAMAMVSVPYDGEAFDARLIFSDAAAAVKGVGGLLSLHASGSRLAFVNDQGGMSTALIDAPYPNLSNPLGRAGGGTVFTVDRESLAESIARAGLSLERNGSVIGAVIGDVLTLTARDEGSDITEVIEISGATGDLRFGINPGYLANLLAAISEPVVEIDLPTAGNGGVRITGIDGDRRSPDHRVLMTKRIDY